jgi:hypothetical protein
VDPAEQLDVLRARDRSRGRSEVPTKPQDLVQRLDVLEPQRVERGPYFVPVSRAQRDQAAALDGVDCKTGVMGVEEEVLSRGPPSCHRHRNSTAARTV